MVNKKVTKVTLVRSVVGSLIKNPAASERGMKQPFFSDTYAPRGGESTLYEIDHYSLPAGYSDKFKRECLKMYVNGIGFRGVERVKGIHHTTVITWVKQVGERFPNAYAHDTISEVGKLDELEIFVSSRKTKFGYGRRLTTLRKES